MIPDDIDPESRCRLALPKRDEMDDEGRRLYDEVATPTGVNIRGLIGPAGIQLHSPKLAQRARPLNRYLRIEANYDARTRELVILVTARECDSQFEWAAHEPEALRQGVAPEIVDTIKHRRSTAGLDEKDACLIELGREVFRTRKLGAATFARARKQFSARALVEIVALMGNYAGTAILLAVFDMQLDPGQEPLLPT
jgi:4-carboxymuconolactone decarboxylase